MGGGCTCGDVVAYMCVHTHTFCMSSRNFPKLFGLCSYYVHVCTKDCVCVCVLYINVIMNMWFRIE